MAVEMRCCDWEERRRESVGGRGNVVILKHGWVHACKRKRISMDRQKYPCFFFLVNICALAPGSFVVSENNCLLRTIFDLDWSFRRCLTCSTNSNRRLFLSFWLSSLSQFLGWFFFFWWLLGMFWTLVWWGTYNISRFAEQKEEFQLSLISESSKIWMYI